MCAVGVCAFCEVNKGVPRWCDRFGQYGIKVSFWASETLKIVIYVENYPQKRCFRLADYHPLWGWGVLIIHPKTSFLGVVFNVDHDFEGPRGPKPHLDTVLTKPVTPPGHPL